MQRKKRRVKRKKKEEVSQVGCWRLRGEGGGGGGGGGGGVRGGKYAGRSMSVIKSNKKQELSKWLATT